MGKILKNFEMLVGEVVKRLSSAIAREFSIHYWNADHFVYWKLVRSVRLGH